MTGALMHNSQEKIGYFLKRNNISNINIKDLIQELHILRFEANIMLQALNHFKHKKLSAFDCLVGDCKCQARTAMILDLIHNNHFSESKTDTYLLIINESITKITGLLQRINSSHQTEKQLLAQKLKQITILEYFNQNDISFNTSDNLILISLCFLTTPVNNITTFNDYESISTNKIKCLLIKAKITLCDLTIQYEKLLAQQYGCSDEQKILTQIESKGFCSMTALMPGFKHILNKVKHLNHFIVKKTTIFCICGGIINTNIKLLQGMNEYFIHIPISDELQDQAVMVIEGYQFSGSFAQLKNILGISQDETLIPIEFYKNCNCANPSKINPINNTQTAFLASLTQHPQFTTSANIDFEGLGLLDTNIHQEYTHLIAQQGYCRNNMQKYYVRHIHPSTIKDALKKS